MCAKCSPDYGACNAPSASDPPRSTRSPRPNGPANPESPAHAGAPDPSLRRQAPTGNPVLERALHALALTLALNPSRNRKRRLGPTPTGPLLSAALLALCLGHAAPAPALTPPSALPDCVTLPEAPTWRFCSGIVQPTDPPTTGAQWIALDAPTRHRTTLNLFLGCLGRDAYITLSYALAPRPAPPEPITLALRAPPSTATLVLNARYDARHAALIHRAPQTEPSQLARLALAARRQASLLRFTVRAGPHVFDDFTLTIPPAVSAHLLEISCAYP